MTWTGAKPPIRAADFEVRPVDIAVAERLVQLFHYAGGASNTAVATHGLFRRGEFWESNCLGVAWWLPPTKNAARAVEPERWTQVLALSRLVVHPEVGGNGATMLMGASIRQIDRARWPWFVTYADDWRGHSGAIYRATGWQPAGRTAPEAVYTLHGRMVSRKAGARTRTHAEMLALGCQFQGRHRKTRFTMDRSAA